MIKIALAGNPNSGKTTFFNEVTGSNQYVGNWPGVTVQKVEGALKGHNDIVLVDLPGIYSLSPYSPEEIASRSELVADDIKGIINIIDSSGLERSLYLTLQLLEMGKSVVVALNMIDILNKRGDKLNIAALSEYLGCPVVEVSCTKKAKKAKPFSLSPYIGIDEVIDKVAGFGFYNKPSAGLSLGEDIESACANIIEVIKISGVLQNYAPKWAALKLLEGDKILLSEIKGINALETMLQRERDALCAKYGEDAESVISNARYQKIEEIINAVMLKKAASPAGISEKIDNILTNKWLAMPIFAIFMWFMYLVSIQWVGAYTVRWMEYGIEKISSWIAYGLGRLGADGWVVGLVVEGAIGGVGEVITFLPQLMVLFLFIAFLESSGYMARVAFIMDRILRSFGLSGKSFIPMLIGTGCSVPGIMATRTIESQRDRELTIMLTPFVPCSAKLPVFALFASAVFGGNALYAASMYFLGIILIVISGFLLKRTKAFGGDALPFVMELPEYKLPKMRSLLIHTWDRSKHFLVKAGTIIFIACSIIWLLQSFNFKLQFVEDIEESMLAKMGGLFAPLFAPLGFGNWQSVAAIATGIVAKEAVVGTFGVIAGSKGNAISYLGALFANSAAAYAFMAFILFAPPCIAAIGAMRTEYNNKKKVAFALAFQFGVAYLVAMTIYNAGTVIAGTGRATVFMYVFVVLTAAALVSFIAYYIVLRIKREIK
jgi:ferrous iron transport protein B